KARRRFPATFFEHRTQLPLGSDRYGGHLDGPNNDFLFSELLERSVYFIDTAQFERAVEHQRFRDLYCRALAIARRDEFENQRAERRAAAAGANQSASFKPNRWMSSRT